jgi:hypothetical protein
MIVGRKELCQVKTGGKVVYHARYVTLHLAEVAVFRRRYRAILDRLRRFAAIPPRAARTLFSQPIRCRLSQN